MCHKCPSASKTKNNYYAEEQEFDRFLAGMHHDKSDVKPYKKRSLSILEELINEIESESEFDINNVPKEFLIGQYEKTTHPALVPVDQMYRVQERKEYMLAEAYDAFKAMFAAAKAANIPAFKIISATRTFKDQKRLWQGKFNGNITKKTPCAGNVKCILRFLSMPGTSRHHWGTDVDIFSISPKDFAYGKGKKIYDWLKANAHRFGFYQPYTDKRIFKNRTGYEEEKWHWSYVPVSGKLLAQYIRQVEIKDITGFKGSEVAGKINMIENYVKGVNPDCK
ncbi:hypothetical protein BH11BAC7_BH11BAC7_04450 [soil metagenome]